MSYPQNAPTPDELFCLSPQEIAQLPVELLAVLQHEIEERLKLDKDIKGRLDGALAVRYSAHAAEERQSLGKDTGTVRFDDGDFTIIANLPERVIWDQDKLALLINYIASAADDPSEFIDTTLKISKRKYGAFTEARRKGFEPARTVKVSTETIKLVPQGADK